MDTRQQNVLLLAVTGVLVAASLWLFLPPTGPDFIEFRDSAGTTQQVNLGKNGTTLPPAGVGATGTAPVTIEPAADSPSGWKLTPSAESTATTGTLAPRGLEFDDSMALGGVNYVLRPGPSKITQGLDIRGGLSVILTAEDTDTVTASDMERAETIVKTRVDSLGVREASVQRQGNDALLVQIPGIKDPQEALKVLGSTGQLEFVEVSTIKDSDAVLALQAGPAQDGQYRRTDGTVLNLADGTYTPFMTGEVITNAVVDQDNAGKIVVNIDMNAAGTRTWGEVTSRLAPTREQIAIVLDGVVKSAPSVNEPILAGSTTISGTFTAVEAKSLKTVLETGALPVSLKFSEARSVGPTLGQDSLRQGVMALVIGFGLVLAYILAFYRGLGILTAGAMLVFAAFFIGTLALLSRFGAFALTLPGIAGAVLTVGMAADSSILILERFKEEIGLGKTVRSAANSGSKHGLLTSLDADLVSFVSAIALYMIAIGPVKGFALTLMIGIAADIVMMLVFKRPSLMLLAEKAIPAAPGFWGVPKPRTVEPSAKKKGGGADA